MTAKETQTTDPEVQEKLSKRIVCLYDMIRCAESSRCLVDWIGTPENIKKTSWGGYGELFGHIQHIAYSDFILNAVALFERDKSSSSFRALFDFICANKSEIKVTGFSRESADKEHSEERLCKFICGLKNKLPVWPHKGFKPEPESLDHALDWMKIKRDKLIAHKEFQDMVAPRASIDMVGDGCGLLPLAMELYDQIYRIAEPSVWNHFETSKINGDGMLPSIRRISKQFEKVVSGEFTKDKAFWNRPAAKIAKDITSEGERPHDS
ncbi:MAG: hypothetical protein ISR84_00250 [Kiritimatiellales bacterium]|nr:hypothetical protein [Kiritimatiellota bacterium]MBL7015966.1 hypothetical protein [Kiritimatiellales bacterium]